MHSGIGANLVINLNELRGSMDKQLSSDDLIRYTRNIKIPSIGAEGQKKLKNSSVLIIGMGGLGSASGLYLAAAGIGRLGLVDNDVVELSNLNRQVMHSTKRLGLSKVESAQTTLKELNPELLVDIYPVLLNNSFSDAILEQYDIVVDGTDNFETRYAINALCVRHHKPFVYGAVFQFSGQTSVFDASHGPCFQCVFHQLPPREVIEANKKPGVIGALPGMIGTIQAVETIKLLLEIGQPLTGRLLVVDGLDMKFSEIIIQKDLKCPICSQKIN
jgi:sulfur-carrier protein adenylyltransferase/sulfurtransferase